MGDTLAIIDRLKKWMEPPSTNGSAPEEQKGATVRFVGSASADFWPHTADDPLGSLKDDGLRRVMAASYVLYSILNYRATKLTEADPYVAIQGEDEPEAVPHDLDKLFREPNPDDDWVQIATVTQNLLDLDGEVLWTLHRDKSGRIRVIRPYHHAEFEVFPGETERGTPRLYNTFRVTHSSRQRSFTRVYKAEDVVYFRTPNPYDRYHPLSPTDAVLNMLGIAGEMQTRVKGIIRNAAVPSGFFVSPAERERMGEDEFERAKNEVNAAYRGASAGRVGLLEGGLTYLKTSMDLNDVKFGDLWREVEAACSAVFSVRPEVLGFLVGLENAPWSHMATARRLVYEDSAIPVWHLWSRALTRNLLTPEERNAGYTVEFDLSNIGALKDDMDRMSRIALRMGDDLSVNERRVMIGKEPTDNPEHDVVGGRGERPGISRPRLEQDSGPAPRQKKDDARVEQWKRFDGLADDQERRLRPTVALLLEEDMEWVLSELEGEVKQDEETRIRQFIARLNREYDQARGAEWSALMAREARIMGRTAARTVADTLSIRFDLMTPGVDAYAAAHAAEAVTQVTATTKAGIRSALEAGLRAGDGIPEIADRIRQAGTFSDSRATLIARTESTTVVNGSQLEGVRAYADETGQRATKEWLATQDDRTRDEHMDLDGMVVEIDGTFPNGLDAPSEPNCRCSLIYAVERPQEGDA